MGDVTLLLDRWNHGDAAAMQELLALVHGELRRIAGGVLLRERDGHTLQPTALVNELYLRFSILREMRLDGRRHFYGAAASAMRRILVDHSRARRALKRGGPQAVRVDLESLVLPAPPSVIDYEDLDRALTSLAVFAPDKARVVELRYFAGLSIEATAAVLETSPATVRRHWAFARAWLYRELSGPGGGPLQGTP